MLTCIFLIENGRRRTSSGCSRSPARPARAWTWCTCRSSWTLNCSSARRARPASARCAVSSTPSASVSGGEGGDRGKRGCPQSLSCPSLPRRRANPAGDHQLRRARPAAAARAGRDPDDHRGIPDALREQRGVRHEEGVAGRAGQIRHGKKGKIRRSSLALLWPRQKGDFPPRLPWLSKPEQRAA